ncbi:MAG TPA: lytic transglycosylase domain-containing protein [Bryobacteraceae bacterium]|nr:lytic transglycosylase domain-containing protein [Bryobacteraceae bacterium]HPT26715.1 lytic transglycosylase domain-containing protein [Bryobacteraceae bacterium]
MAQAICFVFACLLASPVVAMAEPRLQVRSVVRADARTGRLVRTSFVRRTPAPLAVKPFQPAPMPAPLETDQTTDVGAIVERTAALHGVDPALVHSVIAVESGFNPLAVSPKGAQGLMQLIPATARRFGVTDSFDAKQNIEAGVKYLRYLQDMFQDDKLALAAYNAGEGAVMKYGGVPPYRETEQYVRKVGKKLEAVRGSGSAQPGQPGPIVPQPNELASEMAEPAAEPVRTLALVTDESGRIHFVTGERSARKSPGTP